MPPTARQQEDRRTHDLASSTRSTDRGLLFLAASIACVSVIGVALAWGSQTLTLDARFTPDRLGAPTNLSATSTFASGEGAPRPVSSVVAYGPAGLDVDVNGIATCQRTKLEAEGPSGCPSDSRIGFGGGVGLAQLGGEPVKEPYTLDLFLAPKEDGHLAILIYASAVDPVSLALVLLAKEVRGPKPYGFGLAVEIPPIHTLPGAADAAVESNYISLGSPDIAYFKRLHGKRELVHVTGLTVPRTCPSAGFPFELTIGFADGTQSTGTYRSPCPRGR